MTGLTWCTTKASWPGPDPAIHVYRPPPDVDRRVKPGDDDLVCVVYPRFRFLNHRDGETVRSAAPAPKRHVRSIRSELTEPGPDPAIHGCRLPPDVNARIKSGHDDNMTIIASYPALCGVSRFSILEPRRRGMTGLALGEGASRLVSPPQNCRTRRSSP